jgi:hypothetical protein
MRTLLAIVPLLVGCKMGTPASPADQLNAILAKEKFGHLDENLLGVTDKDVAKSPLMQIGQFTLLGLISGELCFSYEIDGSLFGEREDPSVRRMNFMKSSTWVFETHDSEDTIRDAWPPDPKTHVTKVELQGERTTTEGWVGAGGSVNTSRRLITRIEACGPAPVVKPTTKYVTVTNFRRGKPPMVLVWKLDAPPSRNFLANQEKRGERPTAPPVTEAPATEALGVATVPPATLPASNDSVMKVLASADDLTVFSAMLAETGIDRELATGGPYMVFALSDRKLAKAKDPSWRKDNQALVRQAVRVQIVIGVVAAGTHTVKTLEGSTFELEFDKRSIRRTKPRTSSITLVGQAKNALIYRQD